MGSAAQVIRSGLKWLFATGDGHFALLFLMLVVCAVASAFGVPHAYGAAAALVPLVLMKLKA